jgi:glucose/arabinose dehydrogenase
MSQRDQPGRLGRRTAIAIAALGVLAAAAVGCACSPQQPATAPPVATSTPTESAPATRPATGTPTPQSAAELPADLAHLRIALKQRWSGFSAPLYIGSARDGSGRLFVVEQVGRIRVIRDGKVQAGNFLDISRMVRYGGEQGLLGLAFSPEYATNGRFYVDYVDRNGDTVIAKGVAADPSSDRPKLTSFGPILRINQPPYPNHKGGGLEFGPDGYLYIGMGDGGSSGDPGDRAQNPRVLLGKLLRIDPEHPTGSKKYAIPKGQPIVYWWAPEVFAIGLRNPWRFSFDASGSALWIADVGQNAWEEIDLAPPGVGGQNWGWNAFEGNHPYSGSANRRDFKFPIAEYPHPEGGSITGGYVYRGTKYPALVGTYVYADFVQGWLGALRTTAPDGRPLAKAQTKMMLTDVGQPSSFGVDENGELFMVDYRGAIFEVTARAR